MHNYIFKGLQILSLFTFMLFVVSCQDEDGVQPKDQFEIFGDEADFYAELSVVKIEEHASLGRRGCFEVVFPITIDFPDGTNTEVASYEDMFQAIKAWRMDNPDADGRPMIALPFEVIHKNGEVISIESEEMLKRLRKSCVKPDRPHDRKRCFKIVFPVTIVFPDGSTSEVADMEAMYNAFREWKANNPDSDERPTLDFPIDAELKSGAIITLESQEQLVRLKKRCNRGDRPGDRDFGACFRIVFPVSIVFPDGTTTEVSGPRAIKIAVKEWKELNPDSDERVMLGFPLTVKFKDGSTQEVSNKEELVELKKECKQSD